MSDQSERKPFAADDDRVITTNNVLIASDESGYKHALMMGKLGWDPELPRRENRDIMKRLYLAEILR